MSAHCKSCDQPIRWEKTTSGRNIPLNAQPVVGGNIMLIRGKATYVTPSTDKAFVAHFKTCPRAAEHRKVR